ncbi:unnamed protein product, partial [Ectocarpus fasciculatus]
GIRLPDLKGQLWLRKNPALETPRLFSLGTAATNNQRFTAEDRESRREFQGPLLLKQGDARGKENARERKKEKKCPAREAVTGGARPWHCRPWRRCCRRQQDLATPPSLRRLRYQGSPKENNPNSRRPPR